MLICGRLLLAGSLWVFVGGLWWFSSSWWSFPGVL